MSEMMEKTKSFFDKNRWIMVFLMAVPFFNDSYIDHNILPDWIMDRLRILVFVILVVLFILRKKKPSRLLLCLMAMEAWWFITTVINYGLSYSTATYKTFIDIVNALSVAMIVEYFRDDGKTLINGLILNFELALYPNFVTVVLNHADHGYYLLGYYAVLILWILPAVCVAALYIILNKKYFRGVILIAVSLATTVIIWCATIIVAMAGMIASIVLGLLLFESKRFNKISIPLFAYVIIALLGNVFVLFIYTGDSFPMVDFIIEKILGRSTNFTDRVPIWQEAMNMIRQKPLIGYGFRPEIHVADWYPIMHAHNQILQRLTATGIIGLILFAIFHLVLILKVDGNKNSIAKIVMIGGVFGICITYLMDAYKKFFRFYLVFFLAYHIDELIANKTNNTDYLLK